MGAELFHADRQTDRHDEGSFFAILRTRHKMVTSHNFWAFALLMPSHNQFKNGTIQRFVAGETFGRKSRRVGKRNTFSALANLVRSRSFRQLCNICYWINFTIVWPCIVTNTLWIKPTDALNFSFIGITTLHVSGSLSAHHQELLAVNRLWYILCSCDRLLPGVGWNCMYSVVNGVDQYH